MVFGDVNGGDVPQNSAPSNGAVKSWSAVNVDERRTNVNPSIAKLFFPGIFITIFLCLTYHPSHLLMSLLYLLYPVRGHQRAPSGSREFKELTKRDALNQLNHELDRLHASVPESRKPSVRRELDGFSRLFNRFLQEEGPSVQWENIEKLPENAHLNRTYKANVPLVLMNSFNTDEDTQKIIRKYKGLQVEIYTFNQSCFPRINRDSLLPVAKNSDIEADIEAWYPPGHGDFYESFQSSGLLKKFIEQGREYCFISNIDNLGATVDLSILNLLLHPTDKTPEFVMEVTDKTKADVKHLPDNMATSILVVLTLLVMFQGGTLIQYENKLRLLEIAQVPKEHVDDFKSIKTFKFFNTNNLWVKLDAIERVLEENTLNMEIIVNNKSLPNGLNVIQLETAVGAAMKTFEGGLGEQKQEPTPPALVATRSQGKTSDLLLVMSNLYSLKNGSLVMSPQRMFPTTPLVKLGDNHFSKVKEFLSRFENIPDLIELDHLTVSGDVTFGRGVALKGTVIIIANHGDRIDIPSGANLENKIVSGNMRILDH
uniref:UTP--glucose-1-phosphate uridylyltransferase n=1 Tax=Timema shepardi TaxID=629360 RepID=A0A7R9B3B6_TIMSH|nr:unnamed protein product [Timema shepardi]